MNKKFKFKRDWLFICSLILLGSFLLHNAHKIYIENRVLTAYINEIPGLRNLTQEEQAAKLSNKIRKDFNVDHSTWNMVSKKNEPFLKFSGLDLLKWKEGHCGKGTRVLVLLLNKIGIDATRVTLYGKDYKNATSHTLVSVYINGEEYLVDSINSNDKWNELLRKNQIATPQLFLNQFKEEFQINHEYVNYSFETFPMVMISKGLKLKNIIFNHSRPPKIFSWIIESVYLQLTIIYSILISVTLGIRTYVIRRYKKKETIV